MDWNKKLVWLATGMAAWLQDQAILRQIVLPDNLYMQYAINRKRPDDICEKTGPSQVPPALRACKYKRTPTHQASSFDQRSDQLISCAQQVMCC